MPTEIEWSYLESGYRLPEGLTWNMAAERRARGKIAAIFLPLAAVPRRLGWGVPYIDGVPLEHS